MIKFLKLFSIVLCCSSKVSGTFGCNHAQTFQESHTHVSSKYLHYVVLTFALLQHTHTHTSPEAKAGGAEGSQQCTPDYCIAVMTES